jgi:Na+(H+)/acetate symporter ActP
MKREALKGAMIGALIGVAIALVYAIYQVAQYNKQYGGSARGDIPHLFDTWFEPGIILAIVGFALGYVVTVSQNRKD